MLPLIKNLQQVPGNRFCPSTIKTWECHSVAQREPEENHNISFHFHSKVKRRQQQKVEIPNDVMGFKVKDIVSTYSHSKLITLSLATVN